MMSSKTGGRVKGEGIVGRYEQMAYFSSSAGVYSFSSISGLSVPYVQFL